MFKDGDDTPIEPIEEEGVDWHRRSDAYFRYLTLSKKVTTFPLLWINRLEYLPGVRAVSAHINPHSSSDSIHQANKFSMGKKLENKLFDIDIVKKAKNKLLYTFGLESSQKINEENSFDVSVYIELCSDSKENLDICTNTVIKVAEHMGIPLEPIQKKHVQAFQSCAPIASDPVNNKQHVNNEATAATAGFAFFNLTDEERENELND